MVLLNATYAFLTEYETSFTPAELQRWCLDRPSLPMIGTSAFLIMILVGPQVMKSCKSFELRNILFLWNMGLAIFSLFASIRMGEFIVKDLGSYSSIDLRRSICQLGSDRVSSLWMYLYTMSKFVQFGDTFFLIIRKKKLMFLHLYHHGIVLGFMWLQFASGAPALKYFMLMNVIIHAMMYFYYALQAAGIRVHKSIAMAITSIQIIQMVAGLATQYLTYHYIAKGFSSCFRNDYAAASAVLVYGSCLYLFSAFFVEKYLTPTENNQNVKKAN